MNPKLYFIILFIVLVSCKSKDQFPEKKSERISVDNTSVTQKDNCEHGPFEGLFTFVTQFDTQDSAFDLQVFKDKYNQFYADNKKVIYDSPALPAWIEINGLLLELTSEAKYAQELEEISVNEKMTDYIQPFVFTRSVDHIYVNLFKPAEINYQHSLGGDVTIRQETTYPESGSVRLHFGMTERQYIELNIRIPEWAEGTHVEVKGVKYFTKPGSFCFIGKKWKDGDLVEIEFPIENYQTRIH
ncbi:beta-L-arabinofuranosidase domain-containing protein [uncultured Draconibacterium sp.]|uniref:beta-L-arabinofuranosidase domain-containing protein n=1 Tax=uncultured Draconibacterium sp. TaxID=1573823 RepID=UPI0029C65570|nr:beta-L-arabinofuranosidase domain-containing protein [uncultured Draconibacterium sp.]